MKTSPLDTIRTLAGLWEDTSPESVNELEARVDGAGLERAVAIIVGTGADPGVAREEARRSAIWLARLDADLAGMKPTAARLRRVLARQVAAVNTLIAFYEGESGGATAVRVVAKALIRQAQHDGTTAQVGSVSRALPGLYSQRRAFEAVLLGLPRHRSPHSLQAVYVADQALRFARLTGIAPMKTVDPDSGQLMGPFHDYFRALERSVSLGWSFTTREIHNGLDLAREYRAE